MIPQPLHISGSEVGLFADPAVPALTACLSLCVVDRTVQAMCARFDLMQVWWGEHSTLGVGWGLPTPDFLNLSTTVALKMLDGGPIDDRCSRIDKVDPYSSQQATTGSRRHSSGCVVVI